MRSKQPPKAASDDLFRARLDSIINMRQELVLLADRIDWHGIDVQLADRFATWGLPAEPVRFMSRMFLPKHTYSLSGEQLNDDLRGQRYRPGMTRGNQRGRHHVVVILHGPIAALAPRAVGAYASGEDHGRRRSSRRCAAPPR